MVHSVSLYILTVSSPWSLGTVISHRFTQYVSVICYWTQGRFPFLNWSARDFHSTHFVVTVVFPSGVVLCVLPVILWPLSEFSVYAVSLKTRQLSSSMLALRLFFKTLDNLAKAFEPRFPQQASDAITSPRIGLSAIDAHVWLLSLQQIRSVPVAV